MWYFYHDCPPHTTGSWWSNLNLRVRPSVEASPTHSRQDLRKSWTQLRFPFSFFSKKKCGSLRTVLFRTLATPSPWKRLRRWTCSRDFSTSRGSTVKQVLLRLDSVRNWVFAISLEDFSSTEIFVRQTFLTKDHHCRHGRLVDSKDRIDPGFTDGCPSEEKKSQLRLILIMICK